ncbi:MAG: SLBB domain-containing protein, partial [Paraclostridium sp.]
MTDKKPSIIQSSLGSVFSVFSEEELKQITDNSKRNIAISGKINNPGIIEIPEKATLRDVIDLAGGIIKNSNFKAAQLG